MTSTHLGPAPSLVFTNASGADRPERSLTGSRANPRHRSYRGSSAWGLSVVFVTDRPPGSLRGRGHGDCVWRLISSMASTGGDPVYSKGGRDAREGNDRPRPARQAWRKVPVDSSGRVHPRGDTPRPRGQARCAVEQAGHRHRPVEGSACRGKGPARTTRVSRGVEAAGGEHRRNEARAEAALGTSLGCHQACAS